MTTPGWVALAITAGLGLLGYYLSELAKLSFRARAAAISAWQSIALIRIFLREASFGTELDVITDQMEDDEVNHFLETSIAVTQGKSPPVNPFSSAKEHTRKKVLKAFEADTITKKICEEIATLKQQPGALKSQLAEMDDGLAQFADSYRAINSSDLAILGSKLSTGVQLSYSRLYLTLSAMRRLLYYVDAAEEIDEGIASRLTGEALLALCEFLRSWKRLAPQIEALRRMNLIELSWYLLKSH